MNENKQNICQNKCVKLGFGSDFLKPRGITCGDSVEILL